MGRKRLEYMDMVKGIGIFGIVVMHSTTVPLQVVFWISSFAPPLFFLASGMLIGCTGETEKSMGDVLRRKGRSLMLPFLWFSLLYILRDFLRVIMGISAIEEAWTDIFSLVTLWGSSVLWFLPALFMSECMFVFLRKRYSAAGTVISCLILTVVSFLLNSILTKQESFFLSGLLFSNLLNFFRSVLRAVYALPFLCIGYYLFEFFRDFWERERKFSLWQSAAGVFLFVSGIPLSVANDYFDFRTLFFGNIPLLAYFTAIISFMGIVLVCKNCRPVKPLVYFGKNSLIIMATHIDLYFLYISLNLANRINEFIPRWNRIFFFVNVVGVILILEVVCIEAVNRFFPFLIGKRKYSHSRKSLV